MKEGATQKYKTKPISLIFTPKTRMPEKNKPKIERSEIRLWRTKPIRILVFLGS
jgi:hypothetical protein